MRSQCFKTKMEVKLCIQVMGTCMNQETEASMHKCLGEGGNCLGGGSGDIFREGEGDNCLRPTDGGCPIT
jgi:hypothetical protein